MVPQVERRQTWAAWESVFDHFTEEEVNGVGIIAKLSKEIFEGVVNLPPHLEDNSDEMSPADTARAFAFIEKAAEDWKREIDRAQEALVAAQNWWLP